jgi:pimeloyl-ACP methyl ester carboxylesterase
MGKSSKKENTFASVDVDYHVTKSSGHVLNGIITHREDLPAVGPIIVFAHGTLSSARHNFTDELSQKLAKEFGFRSYRFDFRFDKTDCEPDHRYRYSGYEDDVHDLEAVIAQLRTDGYTPWCLLGHSRGSNDVLLYAAKHCHDSLSSGLVCSNTIDSINTAYSSCASLEHLTLLDQDQAQVQAQAQDEAGESKSSNESNTGAATPPALTSTSTSSTSNPAHAHHKIACDALVLVVAAPRFDMKCMAPTIFSAEQLAAAESAGRCAWPTQRGELTLTQEDLHVTNHVMDMGRTVREIPGQVPILLLHGTDDELIPVGDASLYKEARPSTEVAIVEGARHAFRGKKQNKFLLETVSKFLSAEYAKLNLNLNLNMPTLSSEATGTSTATAAGATAAAMSEKIQQQQQQQQQRQMLAATPVSVSSSSSSVSPVPPCMEEEEQKNTL